VSFPANDPLTRLLLEVPTFRIGVVARPHGSALFGAYSDCYGRKIGHDAEDLADGTQQRHDRLAADDYAEICVTRRACWWRLV
jgi:hypothetical protein